MTYQQKIVPLSFFSKNNLFISNFIKETIPFYYHYFLPVLSYKPVLINGLITDKYIVIESRKVKTKKFQEMIINCLNKKKQSFLFFESFRHLYEICKVMQKNNLVHFNLCEDTIIFTNELPYIQDFSQSFLTSEITEERKRHLFEIYRPELKHRPPSWHLFCYISQNNIKSPSLNTIDIVFNDYLNLEISQDFSLEFREIWAQRLEKFIHKSKDEIFRELLKESLYWDMYSVSFLYLKHFHRLNKQNIFTQNLLEILKKNLFLFRSE
jgi:hypothetical protein